MYDRFKISKKTIDLVNTIEKELTDEFYNINEIYEYNQLKVLNAFISNKVSESDFVSSTGYGYNDLGRDKIEAVYKDVFNAQSALVRQQIVSGTHAIALAIFAFLRPNDKVLSISGLPYDTLHSALGIKNNKSSLKEYNICFDYIDIVDNDFDYNMLASKLKDNYKLIMIQRSRGYSENYPFSIKKIEKIIAYIKSIYKNTIVLVDNCYGEFVEKYEPTDVGADIICGSLIKNPGGSLAMSGGYIIGNNDLIELCADRLTAPGIGKEVGINFGQNRNVLQGLYLAPQIVKNSLKINRLFSKTFNALGIDTIPMSCDSLHDIVLSIEFKDKGKLIKFCNVIQHTSPVDSFLEPISDKMPGYDSDIIMAAGSFISGSSIELSCDAPIRPPYIAYLQGGLSYYQGKLALMKSIDELELL